MDWKCQICNQDWRVLLNASPRLWQLLNFTLETLRVFLRQLIASWNNESEVPDFMNGNRKFDVSLDGTLLSHTMNLNAFVLTPAVRICWVRSVRGRKWQPEVDFFLPLSGTSIFSLRKVPNEFTMSFISAVKLLINAEYISFLFIKEVIIALQQSCQRCILGQIWFQRNFDLNEVDSQFPLSCSPKRQRKLKINLV